MLLSEHFPIYQFYAEILSYSKEVSGSPVCKDIEKIHFIYMSLQVAIRTAGSLIFHMYESQRNGKRFHRQGSRFLLRMSMSTKIVTVIIALVLTRT